MPFDFRHHKPKPKFHRYPRAWIEEYKTNHPAEFPELAKARALAAAEEVIIPN